MDSIRVDQYKADYFEMNRDGKIFLPYRILTGGSLADDDGNNETTCYKIRSYVAGSRFEELRFHAPGQLLNVPTGGALQGKDYGATL